MIDQKAEKPVRPDTTDYARRGRVNLYAGLGIAALLAITWLTVKLFMDQEKLGACIASGRKDCVDIGAGPRAGAIAVTK